MRIRESGRFLMSDKVRFEVEQLENNMPQAVKDVLHTVNYASFTSVAGLIFVFSPTRMEESGFSKDQAEQYVAEKASVFSPLKVLAKFEEESKELSFNEELRERALAQAEEE